MLSSATRLRAKEVADISKRGKSLRGRFIHAKYLRADGTMRSAAAVPKSVAKKAVDRNKLRRAIYQALHAIPRAARPPVHIVFYVRTSPPRPAASAIRLEVEALLSKI